MLQIHPGSYLVPVVGRFRLCLLCNIPWMFESIETIANIYFYLFFGLFEVIKYLKQARLRYQNVNDVRITFRATDVYHFYPNI